MSEENSLGWWETQGERLVLLMAGTVLKSLASNNTDWEAVATSSVELWLREPHFLLEEGAEVVAVTGSSSLVHITTRKKTREVKTQTWAVATKLGTRQAQQQGD